jgi:hypothetical protein
LRYPPKIRPSRMMMRISQKNSHSAFTERRGRPSRGGLRRIR